VDDHELVRRGLHALLVADLTQEVVGEASSADEAVEMAATLTPDVVVIDVHAPRPLGDRSVPRYPLRPRGDTRADADLARRRRGLSRRAEVAAFMAKRRGAPEGGDPSWP
jgi:DNA-binding NarL/FixJ family response regulator